MHCAKQGRVPKAVIVVNLYGQSADYDPILDICSKHHVPVIEDAAESLGATYKGRLSGSIGYFGVYSFNGNKIITTSGGGMLVSDDEDAIKKVRFWVTQARDNARHYQHSELGYNYRMSNILAAIGRGQLRALKQRIEQKKHIYETYKENLSCIEDIVFMPIAAYGEPNFWLSVMTLSENSKVRPIDIMMELEKHNIESRPVWKPMQLQPYYSDCEFFSHTDEGASISEDIFERGVCLPSDTKLCDSDIAFIVSIIERKLLQN
jgi:pyridoxal phosphate-dependent aminotransferase EpsN